MQKNENEMQPGKNGNGVFVIIDIEYGKLSKAGYLGSGRGTGTGLIMQNATPTTHDTDTSQPRLQPPHIIYI
jgi:hypothetical protein